MGRGNGFHSRVDLHCGNNVRFPIRVLPQIIILSQSVNIRVNFLIELAGDMFQQTLWSFLMKQIIGFSHSKEVTDSFEVWRVERQKQKIDQTLGRRLIHLHNSKVGRELSLDFDIRKIAEEVSKLAGNAPEKCVLGFFTEEDFKYCGITNATYSAKTRELLL